jgi:hypothetical protein
MSIYLQTAEEDYAYSGPAVWPKTTAYETVDRYIFRRPELAYLKAVRILQEERPSPNFIRVRISREFKNGSRKKVETIGAFVHRMDPDHDLTEDITTFLKELRQVLYRILPDSSQPNLIVRLRFINPQSKQKIASFQERWL